MDGCECPICKGKMVTFKHVPSALDDIVCPKCGCVEIGFLIPLSLGSCVVDCRCMRCSHKWSVHVVLPKNLLDANGAERHEQRFR